jgi:hypothetical protein
LRDFSPTIVTAFAKDLDGEYRRRGDQEITARKEVWR